MLLKRAAEVLRSSEHELRELLARGAAAGDYDVVERLAVCARSLAEALALLEGSAVRRPSNIEPEAVRPAVGGTKPERPAVWGAAGTRRTGVAKARNGSPAGYPRFLRKGSELVKVAWSKRERREYRHRAPFQALQVLCEALEARAARGGLFTLQEDESFREADGTGTPGYQLYVCLAWLKSLNLVVQQGRQGYAVCNPVSFREDALSSWNSMPQS